MQRPLDTVYVDGETNSIADLVQLEPYRYLLTRIVVPTEHRHKGVATKLLERIITQIDEHAMELEVHPVPYDDTVDRDKLIAWYHKNGFVQQPDGRLIRPRKGAPA